MDTWATSSVSPQLVTGGKRTRICSRARSRWTCGRRRTTSSAPGCSRRWCARISRTTRCRGPTRRSPDGCSIPIARRCRSRRATSSRRWRCSQEYGSDGVRYWAARGGPGVDTAFDVGQMKIGRKLAMKVLNVSKFVLGGEQPDGAVTEPLDRGMLQNLAALVDEATAELEQLRIRAGARQDRIVLLGLLRQLRRGGEVAHVRRLRSGAPRHRRPRRCGWRCRCCCGCWRRTCRLRARRCGRGPMPDRSIARRGRRATRSSACRAPTQSAQQAVIHVTEALNAIRKGKVDQKVSIGTPVQRSGVSGDRRSDRLPQARRARSEGGVAHRRLMSAGRRRAGRRRSR